MTSARAGSCAACCIDVGLPVRDRGNTLGFEGPVIAGRVLDTSGGLQVGDWLNINTPLRQIRVQCEGFPLINWGRTENWVSIAVCGLPSGVDLLGLIAEASVSGRSD